MRPSTARLLRGAVALALLALGTGSCGKDPAPPPPCRDGYVPAADGSCTLAPPTCVAGAPGSIVEACATEHRACFEDQLGALCGVCLPGFVEDDGACRPVIACGDLDCAAEGRTCADGGSSRDAQCGACLPGNDALAGRCIHRTCSTTEREGSIAADCASKNRTCDEEGLEEAACGGCYPGFVEKSGTCRLVRSCGDLGCAAANRTCTAAQAHADAACGACRAGFVALGGECAPISDATCDEGSAEATPIAAACAAEHRACDSSKAPAVCGACEGSFVLDHETFGCEPFVPCSQRSCETEHRACVEAPQGRCAGCLPGFVEDPRTGSCRQVRTCASLTCGAEQACTEATDETDAICRPACADGEIWGGSQCAPCPACDDEGEDGRWPFPTSAGSCICKTKPGYFYSTAGDVGTFRCDADGDGWVRESARLAIQSKDPALRTNARCELRTIDRVELQNEAGDSKVVRLSRPLELFETDRNDDQALLDVHWRSKGLPAYGAGRLSARELNRFTKVCHDRRADYNDNGIADVSEWSGHSLGPTMRPEQQPFNEFSYFVELYRGSYRSPAGGEAHGTWVIQEKSRLEAPAGPDNLHVPLSYAASDGAYWRQCKVDPDPRWRTANPPVGMDFARYTDPATFNGLGHHSQFKCLVVDDEPSSGAVQELTPDGVKSAGFRLSRCGKAGPAVVPGGTNPSDTVVGCERVDASSVRPGDVLWGAVPYRDYGPTPYMRYDGLDMGTARYQGGCVNSCVEALASCPGYDINPIAAACLRDPRDFGKFLGCSAWEVCDGLDNDGDGVVDNGDPGGGVACDTGRFGVCEAGTTHCIGGEIVCTQDVPETAEICNGLDDDCNGAIDETFPGKGDACTVPNLKGECAKGRKACASFPEERPPRGEVFCQQVKFPEAETCADALDHDCDGNPYTENGSDENIAGCIDYYYDGDGDGFADRNVPPKCLCSPKGKYRIVAPTKWDCCDSDPNAYPDSNTFRTGRNACGSFDWNCDGVEEKQNTAVSASCKYKVLACSLNGNAGWEGAVPACGESQQWVYDCHYNVGGAHCDRDGYLRTQACR
ncbi:MopE-related protein [Vulgatibacter incomptus]|uniref:Tryptophan synthase alpha chain n=1 Tax=Vulgatibacter incomptus TaxID=1391653 RepID=A0A0K1PF68_9BACT|nr:MopE-related protein [Vulgatibacter incomptus]AKU92178.1 hypothetical protein AKJ08_2565 [Vulgatibacter incomptus]